MVLKSKLSMDDFKKIERDITATTFTEIIRYEELDKDSKMDYEHEIAL